MASKAGAGSRRSYLDQFRSALERFADQHRLVRRPERPARRGSPGPVLNEAESPLGWLRSRRDKTGAPLISEAQYHAGERLRADFTIAQLSPRVTLSWDSCIAPGSHGRSGRRPDSLEVNETALAARQRFMRALDAVGPELSGIVVDVCCLSRGLEAAERSLGWPQRSGKLVLQIALTQLARHYGLTRTEANPQRPACIRILQRGQHPAIEVVQRVCPLVAQRMAASARYAAVICLESFCLVSSVSCSVSRVLGAISSNASSSVRKSRIDTFSRSRFLSTFNTSPNESKFGTKSSTSFGLLRENISNS